MFDHGKTDGFPDLIAFNMEVSGQTLERLGDGPRGHRESAEIVENRLDFVGRDRDVIFQADHRGQRLGSQITVGNFIGSRRGDHVLMTGSAPIGMMNESGDFDPSRDDVFLNMG